jgi:hypothetical protein
LGYLEGVVDFFDWLLLVSLLLQYNNLLADSLHRCLSLDSQFRVQLLQTFKFLIVRCLLLCCLKLELSQLMVFLRTDGLQICNLFSHCVHSLLQYYLLLLLCL